MKLVICGKGGSGKSTVAAMLAKTLVKNGKSVVVIDTDESNFGLHRQLGVSLPPDFMGYFGGKKAVVDKIMKAAPEYCRATFIDGEITMTDIPARYIAEKDGVKLIAIGKIHEVGEGCACSMGVVAKEFIEKLKLKDNEVAIIDTEAGIEHFGRSVEISADAILMVIDPSYESLKLSEKVTELCRSIKKPIYFVLNKVDASSEMALRNAIRDHDAIVATIPADNGILLAGLKGEAMKANNENIQGLYKTLMSRPVANAPAASK